MVAFNDCRIVRSILLILFLWWNADSGPTVEKRQTELGAPYIRVSLEYTGNATITVTCDNLGNFTFSNITVIVCLSDANVTTCSTTVQPTRCIDYDGHCGRFKTWKSSVKPGAPLLFSINYIRRKLTTSREFLLFFSNYDKNLKHHVQAYVIYVDS